MFPETEAQKVIAISLGKIAISRSQRGGPKLFKNLLVANVIQKARYVAWDENAHRVARNNSHEWQVPIVNHGAVQSVPNCNLPASESLSLNDVHAVSNEFHRPVALSRDSEISSSLPSNAMEVITNCVCWDEHNKENVLPNTPENATTDKTCNVLTGEKLYYSSAFSIPSRCVKRRSSTTAEDGGGGAQSQSTKKPRRDYLCPRQGWRRTDFSVINADSESDAEDLTRTNNLTCGDDQMDLEQISSLVSVFSSSFKGLVDAPKTTGNNSGDVTGFYGEKIARRGPPDVCSKQAGSAFTVRQSSFEASSSPPIVALAV